MVKDTIEDLVERLVAYKDELKKINVYIGKRSGIFALPAFVKAPGIEYATKIEILKKVLETLDAGKDLDVALARGEAAMEVETIEAAQVDTEPAETESALIIPRRKASSPPLAKSEKVAGDQGTLARLRKALADLGIPGATDTEALRAELKAYLETKINESTDAISKLIREKMGEMKGGVANRVIIQVKELPAIEVEHVHPEQETLLKLFSARKPEPIMLVGPTGSGKTAACKIAADALGLKCYDQSFCRQTSMAHLLGYMTPNGSYIPTPLRLAYEKGGVWLGDEADNGNPNIWVVLHMLLENGHCTFPNSVVQRHPDFRAVLSANTYGKGATRDYVGRNQMDAATMSRMTVLNWDYDEGLELKLYGVNDEARKIVRLVQCLRQAALDTGIRHIICPRSSRKLVQAMLECEIPKAKALEMCVFKGLDPDQCKKLSERASEIARGQGETSTN